MIQLRTNTAKYPWNDHVELYQKKNDEPPLWWYANDKAATLQLHFILF